MNKMIKNALLMVLILFVLGFAICSAGFTAISVVAMFDHDPKALKVFFVGLFSLFIECMLFQFAFRNMD